jgi:tetratricopeptide (TPR) repeat protein
MNKENVLFGVIGLLLGCIVGFLFANNLNQSEAQIASVPQAPISAMSNPAPQNQNLPPDHPQVGGANGKQVDCAQLPEVDETVKNAESKPGDFKAQADVGDGYYQFQCFDEAAKFYERAVKIRPDSVETLVKAGNAQFDAENYEAAEKWYTAALAKNPDDVNVRTDLGLSFYLRNPPNVDRAIKEYKTSLEKSPNHELSLQNLVVALREKGDTGAAQEAIDKLTKINPNNPLLTNIK